MDIAANAKKKLQGLFEIFIENPDYEGVHKSLVEMINAYHMIGKVEKKLEEDGYE